MNGGRFSSCVRAGAAAVLCAATAGAQASLTSNPGPPPVKIVLLAFAFYGEHANSIEPGDSAMGDSATAALRRNFALSPEITVADSAAVTAAESSRAAIDTADGHPCNTIVACGRVVGRAAGARYVVMGTISKTSNLIWLFSGQLVDVTAHDLVMDDEYELKGNSREMVAQGSRVFARRVAKKLGAPPATGTTQ
jgi:TolB-like protein